MNNQAIFYLMGIAGGGFVAIIVAYLFIRKALDKGDRKRIRQLREGTASKNYSADVIYQRLYNTYNKIPFLKRYLKKIRRKLEIIHMQDEYKTRKQASQIITKAICIIIPLTLVILMLTKGDMLLRVILLLMEVFLTETLMTGSIDKLDTKLLKQQVDFFAEIRHAYHEYNMVEEAIYEVSQNDELEVSVQGQKIYEILISDDPESELEKYYDVAPNSYLKEFAGVSYLTREFGDRTLDNGSSLYLKNLNNITQEMQMEILKRDKLDYVFQSLSIIAILPVLFISPLKNWSISNFAFTKQFYDGKLGLYVEIALLMLTFVSYILIRKIKDTGSIKNEYKDPNKVWQMKLYNNPIAKKVIDLFIPKKNSKQHRVLTKLMKESAYKQKMQTFYVNKIVICIATAILTMVLFNFAHKTAINYVYTEPTADYSAFGSLTESDERKGMLVTEEHNRIIDEIKGNKKITKEEIATYIHKNSEFYAESTDAEIDIAAEKIHDKLGIINKEGFKWFELLISFIFGYIGYCVPVWLLMFQKTLRKLEMENEVMEYQTIILMLMKIERVNVEMILEWIERYSNIFREPITKCVNNYEAGAWEALEQLKDEIAFPQLERIIESMQSAVEKIPISEAFDELDNEREYYQAKREESNQRLISRKGMIGKVIGFAPMVVLFVGYLIAPLIIIGLSSMGETFSMLQTGI